MNASMPTPASDFSALTGGFNASAKCTVSLNGETVAATTVSNASGDTDFASLLAESGSGNASSAEQSETAPVNDVPAEVFPVIASEDAITDSAAIQDGEGDVPAGETTPDAVPTGSTQEDASVENPAQPDAAGCAKGRKKNRHIHGLGRFLHACGRHLSTGMKQGQARSSAASSEVPAELVASPAKPAASAKPAAAQEIAPPAVCISIHTFAPATRPVVSCGLPSAPTQGVGDETSAVETDQSQTTTTAESPKASAPAGGLAGNAAANRPFGIRFAHRTGILPSFAKHVTATEATTSSASTKTNPSQSTPSAPARVTVSPDVRLEITETLKTLLAPVMQELAAKLSTAVSPAKAASPMTPAIPTEAATILVKVDGLPPFRIELPPMSTTVEKPVAETFASTEVSTRAQPISTTIGSVSAEIPAAPASSTSSTAEQTGSIVAVARNDKPGTPESAQAGADAAESSVDFVQLVASNVAAACAEAREVLPAEWPELAEAAPMVVAPASAEGIAVSAEEIAPANTTNSAAQASVQPNTKEQTASGVAVSQETAVPADVAFKVALPGLGTLEAVFATVTPAAETPASTTGVANRGESKSETASATLAGITAGVGSSKAAIATGLPEKSAGDSDRKNDGEKHTNKGAERIFLTTGNQSVKEKTKAAGIDVAKSDDAMPASFTSHRVAVDQLELPATRLVMRDFVSPAFSTNSATESSSASSTEATTPAPVLAHRAVETILNVVEAQRSGLTQASSVNLHFKFGGDDLAVRVQLRGSEVHTQFLTDSPDLRAALASEWQNLASQGAASNLKLTDPVIMPATAQVSTGFGSASQHHQSTHHQHAQQHQQAQQQAAAFQELRGLRRPAAFGTATPAVNDAGLRRSPQRAGSLHLAALA